MTFVILMRIEGREKISLIFLLVALLERNLAIFSLVFFTNYKHKVLVDSYRRSSCKMFSPLYFISYFVLTR